MSGHSHWATIRRKKEAADAKKGKVFSKLARALMSAARQGGGDPETNVRLKALMDEARASRMPRDNIERAVKKGTGDLEGQSYTELTYEGYGPEGVAFLVDAMTDNSNRTVSDLRHVFGKHDGKLGEPGSVAWMFEQKGEIILGRGDRPFVEVFELALEAGAEDVDDAGDRWRLITARDDLYAVAEALEAQGAVVAQSGLIQVPATTMDIDDLSLGRRIVSLYDAIDDHDDVQKVWASFDIDDAIAEQLDDDA